MPTTTSLDNMNEESIRDMNNINIDNLEYPHGAVPIKDVSGNVLDNSQDETIVVPDEVPNYRSWAERTKVLAFGTAFRALVDTVSLPVMFTNDDDMYKTEIDTPMRKCRLCIYLPKNLEKVDVARGVVMHLHGGGWTISRPETEAPICRYIADHVGVVVIAPDYCKAPQYPYPCALHQCYGVLSWIANGGLARSLESSPHPLGKTIQVDATRIALMGGSSGSNLAAALTVLSIARPLPSSSHIAALGILYPVLNLSVSYDEKIARVDPARNLPKWASRFFLVSYLPPPRTPTDPLISPALAPIPILRKFPKTAILTAAYDYLHYEADEFARKLGGEGVWVVHRRFEDVGHAFDGLPAWDKKQRMLNEKAKDEAWGILAEVFKDCLTEMAGDRKKVEGVEGEGLSESVDPEVSRAVL